MKAGVQFSIGSIGRNNPLTAILTYLSDWWRMNFLVRFLTILGFVRGLRAAMVTEDKMKVTTNKDCLSASVFGALHYNVLHTAKNALASSTE